MATDPNLLRVVSRLTGGFIDLGPDDAGVIEIRTQVEARAGRPDLEICIPHRLVWTEVKAESALITAFTASRPSPKRKVSFIKV